MPNTPPTNHSATAGLVVILATHNGSSVLDRTLAGYAKATTPAMPWQLVVVDNASTDDTPQVLTGWQDKLPLTVIKEATPGKNRALNKAIDIIGCEGALYIFTDDDAIPDPDFLCEWETAFNSHPEARLWGGWVSPVFLEQRPAWLEGFESKFPEIYAINQRDDGIMPAREIFGPNMAVHGEMLRKGNRFNEAIGPNSSQKNYPMGSETEFCTRTASALPADSVRFASSARVGHQIRPTQMTPEFVAARAYRHGRGYAMQRHMEGAIHSRLMTWLVASVWRLAAAISHRPTLTWQCHWAQGYRDFYING